MRKLAIFSCSFAAACAAYIWLLSPKTALLFSIALLSAAMLLLFLKNNAAKRCRIAAVAMAIGLVWSYGYEAMKIAPLRELCGEDVLVQTTLSNYPEKTQYGYRMETSVGGGTMLLYLNGDYSFLKPGDRVTLQAEVVDVSRGSGDEENLYFQSRDISLLAFPNEEPRIETAKEIPLGDLPAHWAHVIRQRITTLFPQDTEGFMCALLTGEKDGIHYAVRSQMSTTGLSHVFSVSGMHVSLLVGFFMLLIPKKRLAAICGIVAMLVFAAMLGFAPSVTRAVIMNTILLLAPIFKRENDPATTLSFALFVILLGNPWAIANLGLQLSFLSMAGIFLFASKLHNKIIGKIRSRKDSLSQKFLRTCSVNFSTSLSAMVLTLPITAITFGTISLISPLANLLLLNLISLIFTSGFAILIAGIVTPFGIALAWLLSWAIRLVMYVMEILAALPFSAVEADSPYFAAWLVAAYMMLAFFLLLRKERKLRDLFAATAATLLCAIGFSLLDVPEGSVTMLDVGQGQSILLQSGDFTAMVDCGGDSGDADGETAARALLSYGHRELDALILTHFDKDHTCGAEQLFERIKVQYLFLPDISHDAGRREEVIAAAENAGVEICFVMQDMTLEAEDAKIELMAPVSDDSDNEGLCALLSMGECDILVTGDMSIDAEHELLKTHNLPQVEILVAGHHGSKYSTSPALLRKTQPQAVLISVGENSYGHPSQEVLERISAVGASVYCTDLNGEITITR